jgi:hypothetical protein
MAQSTIEVSIPRIVHYGEVAAALDYLASQIERAVRRHEYCRKPRAHNLFYALPRSIPQNDISHVVSGWEPTCVICISSSLSFPV